MMVGKMLGQIVTSYIVHISSFLLLLSTIGLPSSSSSVSFGPAESPLFNRSSSTTTMILPGQHPDPESVAQQVIRQVNASLAHYYTTRAKKRRLLQLDETTSNSDCHTGNPIDDCWRCDPTGETNRQRLADCAIGFGSHALGGKGGRYYVVTDPSDTDAVNPKPGTLRYAVIQVEPLWIVFSHNMIIRLSEELIFNSYKTLDGRGADVHVTGGGCITIQGVNNVIIHNIHVHHCHPSGNTMVRASPTHYGLRGMSDGDGISISESKDVWIDHCTLSHCRDGLIDAVLGSTGITISNSYFSHHNEVMLLGHSDAYTPDTGMQVTIAFNVFGKDLVQRMPRCRRGYIHVVNNDFTQWEMYAIGGSGNPTINSQGNRYIAPKNPYAKEVTKRVETDGNEWMGWNWRSEGDVMINGAYFVVSGAEVEAQYEKAYSTQPKSADSIDQLTRNSGVFGTRNRHNNQGKLETGPGGDGSDLNDYGDNDYDYSGGETTKINRGFCHFLSSMLFTVLLLPLLSL